MPLLKLVALIGFLFMEIYGVYLVFNEQGFIIAGVLFFLLVGINRYFSKRMVKLMQSKKSL